MSSSPPQFHPHPQSSPTPNEARRSSAKVGRGTKCSFKSKTASTNSVCKTEEASDTTMKTVMVLKGEQKPQEPCTTCTVVQPTKNRRTVNDEETYSEIKGDLAHLPSGKGPEVQPKDEDVTLGSGQKQTLGVTFDSASHTNKLEVRNGFLF